MCVCQFVQAGGGGVRVGKVALYLVWCYAPASVSIHLENGVLLLAHRVAAVTDGCGLLLLPPASCRWLLRTFGGVAPVTPHTLNLHGCCWRPAPSTNTRHVLGVARADRVQGLTVCVVCL